MIGKTKSTTPTEEAKPAMLPKLRFTEFRKSEGWPQQQLGSVATFFKGKGLPKSALTPDGKRPCIHYGELFTVYPEVIGAVKSRTNSEEDVFLSVENDVLMPTSDVTPSGLAKACCLNFEDVILGGDILVIRTDRRSINGEFLARYIRHLERKVLQLVSGSTVFHLYASSMEKLVLSFPPERAEQRKIAECLSSLDGLIAAQARKVEALKSHKKGLMQQLFPREGESQPRIRFPEFQNAGEWGETKLGKHVEIQSGYSPSGYALSSNGEYAFVKVEDLNNCIKYQVSGREFCDDSDGVVPMNSILFPKRGAAIELNKIRITASEILIDTNLMALTPKDGLKVEFLYYFLSNVGLSHIADTSTIPQINNKHIIPFDLRLPEEAEQERIASCLTSLDDLIAAQAQKLEALKTHKKGLMQQLFPSPEEE
jgi:type I restriction enzyme S subunit